MTAENDSPGATTGSTGVTTGSSGSTKTDGQSGTRNTGAAAGAGSQKEWQPRPPPRPVPEIINDLAREREGLVDAVDTLKLEARETKDRLVSPRTFAIVGGALTSLFLLRRRRRRKHH